MKKATTKKKNISCIDCDHCVYMCEGDFICDANEPVLIQEDFCPNENYFYCGGEDYESWDDTGAEVKRIKYKIKKA